MKRLAKKLAAHVAAIPAPLLSRLLPALSAIAPAIAHATGGLDQAQTGLSNFEIGLFACAGIVAIIYLIFEFVQVFGNRKTWIDMGEAVLKVIAAGAAVVLATWAWNVYGG
ncbi:hypothetical protein C0Z18_26735 [Trinickia dabaoshanensis]|uniref:TIGR03745 family integrating conjugative element membrane protein n=1 Tax=Trinickia dabaoshanensis TaxID=564714 RepID=A0A2N7VEN3_9BURK|nr:hypothetical protein [Trinickia dabaoshanensis]PMS15613.1 hypothetical protein C0Z18_26735 [Trinickia dabaoshanensis]